MAAGFFDVPVPTLRDGVGWLGTDAESVDAAGTTASGAAGDAGANTNGGELAAASAEFSQAIDARSAEMTTATTGAGTTLGGNADRYALDDGSAVSGLGALGFETGGLR